MVFVWIKGESEPERAAVSSRDQELSLLSTVKSTGKGWLSPITAAIAKTRRPLNSVGMERGAPAGQEIPGSN